MRNIFLPSGFLVLILGLGGLLAASAIQANQGVDFADPDAEENAVLERPVFDSMRSKLEALTTEIPAVQQVRLPLDSGATFLALEIKALAAKPKGNLLILPGADQHPDWPEGLAPLRRVMPEYGWTSLALSLPAFKVSAVPQRTLGTGPLLDLASLRQRPAEVSNSVEPEVEQDLDEEVAIDIDAAASLQSALATQSVLVEERVTQAQKYLDTRGQLVLVLQGESIYWLQNWLAKGNLKRNQPLILLFVEAPVGVDEEALAALIQQLGQRPILDIYAHNNDAQVSLALKRKQAYMRAGNKHAVQLELSMPANSSDGTANRWLIQRVEGWLRSL